MCLWAYLHSMCVYIFTHVCAVCASDHAKSCVPTWTDFILFVVVSVFVVVLLVVVDVAVAVALLFLIVFLAGCACRSRHSAFGLRPTSFVVNSWKNHKNKSNRIFERNSSSNTTNNNNSEYILAPFVRSLSLHPCLARHVSLSLLLSCQGSAFCPLNTLSSSVLFFWSWFVLSFVLSFNVLRTRFHWPWLPLPFWTNYFSRRCVNDVAVAVAVDVSAENVCDQHCLGSMARQPGQMSLPLSLLIASIEPLEDKLR